MAKLKLKTWDSAEHLKTEKDIAAYFNACLEEAGDDSAFIAHALGIIARARGMGSVAKKSGMSREALYRALSMNGNPEFATIWKVLTALGFQLKARIA